MFGTLEIVLNQNRHVTLVTLTLKSPGSHLKGTHLCCCSVLKPYIDAVQLHLGAKAYRLEHLLVLLEFFFSRRFFVPLYRENK